MAAVIHVKKGSGSSGGLDGHIDRTYRVKNADATKQHLNFYVYRNSKGKLQKTSKNPRKGSIYQRCLEKIENSTITRKIQKNAVTRLNFILSASNEEMTKIEAAGKLDNWVAANYKFISNKYREENIVEFAVHLDEYTPHIHCVIVPIVKDLDKNYNERERLTARELLLKKGDINRLSELQSEYSAEMNKFGIEKSLRGSRAIHKDSKIHNAEIISQAKQLYEYRDDARQKYLQLQKHLSNLEKKTLQEARNLVKELENEKNRGPKLF